MRRTIEKLAGDRRELEERFRRQLDGLKAVSSGLAELEKRLSEGGAESAPERGLLSSRTPSEASDIRRDLIQAVSLTKTLADSFAALHETAADLGDVRDKEWDALGNNHLGLVFKSMEWRVDRLAAASEDVAALMKTFVLLQDKLGRLLTTLEEKKLPSPGDVHNLLDPIRDWRYTRFENRHRGAEAEVRAQLERYLPFFRPGGEILDLGCGRGEFLELLRRQGFRGSGVDLNTQMIGACLDKGLDARKADLLEALAERADASLDGIFSAQVIEHLSPAVLNRLVDTAYAKLAPGGVLILETINPTSIHALVHAYYMDMSHRSPVHPEALRFLMEAAGFDSVEVVFSGNIQSERLRALPGTDASSTILNDNIDRLNGLLYGDPNYAAVGRKK